MSPVVFHDGRVVLHAGDCMEVIRTLPDGSIDGICTDPPYALVSIVKRFGKEGAANNSADAYRRASAGFMGKQWDTGEVAFAEAFWAECLRVLKPGGHVAAFSGTRSYHHLATAIDNAGFEIRDQLGWAYGTGFPKSHNLKSEFEGFGTALKPAWEPICLGRKPLDGTVLDTMRRHGVGALNLRACRVGDETRSAAFTSLAPCKGNRLGDATTASARRGTQGEAKTYLGRHPANILHDGSDDVLAAFSAAGDQPDIHQSGARFFWSAKADAFDRAGSRHPTVKPVDVMRWLCRLILPTGGVVLDPFAGTGTTAEAALLEGFAVVLIEREAEYQADIARRMDLVFSSRRERLVEAQKIRPRGMSDAPLFELDSAGGGARIFGRFAGRRHHDQPSEPSGRLDSSDE